MRSLSFEGALDKPFKAAMSDFDAAAWRPFLRSLDGRAPTPDQMETFWKLSGRTVPFAVPPRQAQACCGRRSGKTRIAALVCATAAAFWDHKSYLAKRGERARIILLSQTRDQATVARGYVLSLLESHPVTKALIESSNGDVIALKNRCDVVLQAASFRSVRGFTVPLVVADEVALWRDADTSQNPAREIFRALTPSMVSVPLPLLLSISTPFAREGWFFDQHLRHHGCDESSVLAIQAPSRTMNPTLDQSVIDQAYVDDPQSAAAEYGGEFRGDIASFVDRDVVMSAIECGIHQRGCVPGLSYQAFTDSSSGSKDSFTLAIAHREGDRIVLDHLVEHRAPFDPAVVIADIVGTMKAYGLSSVTGDRYALGYVSAEFTKRGVSYRYSMRDRSEIYLAALPLLNARRVQLLDSTRLVNQLTSLQRRTSSGGRQSVDHPRNGADDLANAAMGAVALCADVSLNILGHGGGIITRPGYLPAVNPSYQGAVDVKRLPC
jgi:Terminase large subunit, T4likevirus-type, N-terminal